MVPGTSGSTSLIVDRLAVLVRQLRWIARTRKRGVELTRFRGHLRMLEGVHDGKAKKIFSGVAGGASAVGRGRAITRVAGERVRADIAGASEVGEAGRARRGKAYGRSDDQGA